MTVAQEPGPPEPQRDQWVEPRRLYRSRSNRVISGVCGGIAEHYGSDPTMVRLLAVILDVFTGVIPLLLAYLIAAIVIPEGDAVARTGVMPPAAGGPPMGQPATAVDPGRVGLIFGVILVTVGLAAYARQVLDIEWDQVWPLMLIAFGGLLLLGSIRR